jgi:hypothetical protein
MSDDSDSLRQALLARIRNMMSVNEECFVGQFILQNPDVNLKHLKLCNGIENGNYEFWIEWKEDV